MVDIMKIMKTEKGKTGTAKSRGDMAIEGIGYLLLAVIALIILWIFLSKIAPDLKTAIVKYTNSLVCMLCEEILGTFQKIFPFCWRCS